jgi:sulfite reductase (ferredoxin)
MLVADDAGDQVEGFQVHLGGELATGFGRKPRGLKVTAAELPDFVERLATRFEKERGADESFATWAQRADEEALA